MKGIIPLPKSDYLEHFILSLILCSLTYDEAAEALFNSIGSPHARRFQTSNHPKFGRELFLETRDFGVRESEGIALASEHLGQEPCLISNVA